MVRTCLWWYVTLGYTASTPYLCKAFNNLGSACFTNRGSVWSFLPAVVFAACVAVVVDTLLVLVVAVVVSVGVLWEVDSEERTRLQLDL